MPKYHKYFNPSCQKINEWFSSDGDNTYSLNHRLDENSVVVELGGYITSWAAKFKEDCQIYVVEPVKKFHDALEDKYKGRKKFKTINVGIGTENKILYLPKEKINNDATDLLNLDENNTSGEKIQIITLEKLMKDNNIEYIDLMQINIEGWEYPILEDWIKTGLIHKIKTLQIQFHPFEGVEDPIGRRTKIQDNLVSLGYGLKFKFDWVWECWEK